MKPLKTKMQVNLNSAVMKQNAKDMWENGGYTPLIVITLISNLATFNSTDFCPDFKD
jgi:hypothetical protein